MVLGRSSPRWWPVSAPSLVFALAFIVLGWVASHSFAYAILDMLSHGHHDEPQVHGYMGPLKLAAGGGLLLAFVLSLRAFFRHGSFGNWMHKGGVSGTRKQIVLATVLPAFVFVLVEYLERFVAGAGTTPSVHLLVIGVYAQIVVGLLCLGLVRLTLRVTERFIHSVTRCPFVLAAPTDSGGVLDDVAIACHPCPMAGEKAGRAPPHSSAVPC